MTLRARASAQVAVLDWGIGGTALLADLRSQRPDLALLYVSDSGYTPYGRLSKAHLCARLNHLLRALAEQGVSHVVLACNAASSTLGDLQLPPDVTVAGVIDPTLRTLLDLAPPTVTILGGIRTIDSGVYSQPLREAGISAQGIIAQPLSALVEAGQVCGAQVEREIALLARSAPQAHHTLVPACTHYLALREQLQAAFNPQQVIDPAQETLRWLLPRLPVKTHNRGSLRCMTSGDPRSMRRAAQRAFGVQLSAITKLVLRP